ncbi:laminin subunit alpha-2 [Plakobranchus ocellatus]|uniref:Laminin subunit alpha-2 n=1 Tax=Plakobranchus ocellatus TaxID=259542 RepID=A0AAV4BBH9_9GAST|nr:laminin subunit alpha-2 [Plakobranchus ocellatus]
MIVAEGMTEAYRVRGKQMLKQFMIKDERGRSFAHDEPRTPEEHENEALRILKEIESRDIHQQLELMKNKEDEMFAFSASIIELERKCLQEKTNINRVRKRLRSRRNLAFQELLDYLTSAVLTMNTGFLYTPSMRLLSFIKRSMDHTYRNLKSGSETIQKAYRSLENTRSSIERNRALIQEWLAKKQKTKQKRMDSHQHRPSRFTSGVVSPEDLGLLNLKVMASDIHSRSLKDRTQRQLSVLVKSLQDAETFLSRPTGSGVVFAQIEPLKQDLQKFTPDMYTLLEEIGNLTGSQVKLKPFKRCMPIQVIEGSGDGEKNEVVVGENPGCDGNDIDNMASSGDGEVKEIVTKDKSSGGGGLFGNFDWWSSNNENEENTNDFTFEEEPEFLLNSTVRPQALTLHRTQGLQEWNRDIKSFTEEILQASQELHDEARVVNTSLADLHQSWKQIQNEVSDLERMVDNQKKMNENMTAKAIVFLDIRGEINKFQPPSLLNLGASLRIARTIERRIQPETMGTEPAQNTQAGWLDDYYDYYDSNYYYEDIVGTKPLTELVQRDATDIDYTELSRMGRQIEDNSNDIHRLRTLSLGTCGRVGSHLGSIHRNLTALREKVNEARDMLNALQLSISKSGKGHIAVSIPSDVKEISNDMTIIRLCMKPATLDGPIILMKGNDSASYSVFLDEGLLSVSLYDAEWSSLKKVQVDSVLQKDVWYTIQIKRLGLFLNVSLQQQGQEKMVKSEHIGLANLDSFESRPERVYLGGVPNDINVVDGFWEGCIGDVAVNGRALNIFRPDSESAGPSLCDSHCLTKKERLSTIFNGDGFLHYSMSTRDVFTSIELSFSTHQDTASLFSYVNSVKGVYLNLLLERSALRVQSTSSKESLVYLSSDKAFSDGKPHRVKIEYEDSAARISIDGVKGDVQVQTRKPNVEKDSLQGLVIGAFVTDERQFSKDNKFRPFIGCIQDVSVNGEKLPFSQAKDVYNVYQGYCTDALENRWHSCRRWGEESSSLVLDEVPQSNIVSLWVSSNATGPVMRYARKDDFSAVITLTLEGLVANIGDSSIPLSRPEEDKSRDMFSLTVVDKPDEKNLLVLAWGQTMEHSYGYTGWFFGGSADPTKPHSLVIAGSGETGSDVEGEDSVQKFAGSLSRFTIENRFVDLNQFEFKHKLLACERPLKNVRPIAEEKTLPVPQITCS